MPTNVFGIRFMVNSTTSDCYAGVQGYGVLIGILAIRGVAIALTQTRLYI